MLQRGQEINQRYRVVRLIGQGGFSAVYRAWDIPLKRPVALKENVDTSAEVRQQFEREATTLANLHHPHLPRVTDHFILASGRQYLVMDFVEGQNLEQIITEQGIVHEGQALAWIRPIADALTYLHTLPDPVIHRDIKPSNIIVDQNDKPFLVDFGLLKLSSHQRTMLGARSVSPGYAPPEQYGGGGTNQRTDIYALGATLYKLLTGITPPDCVKRLANDKLEPAHIANRAVSEQTGEAIRKAMALSAKDRFPTVAAFVETLPDDVPSVTPSGKNCTSCGSPLHPDSQFCDICGADQSPQPTPSSQPIAEPPSSQPHKAEWESFFDDVPSEPPPSQPVAPQPQPFFEAAPPSQLSRRFEAATLERAEMEQTHELFVKVALPDSQGLLTILPKNALPKALRDQAGKQARATQIGVAMQTLPVELYVELEVAASDFRVMDKFMVVDLPPEQDSKEVVFRLDPVRPTARAPLAVRLLNNKGERLGDVRLEVAINEVARETLLGRIFKRKQRNQYVVAQTGVSIRE